MKKCPKLIAHYPVKSDRCNCIKKECATWNKRRGVCDPTGMLDVAIEIAGYLAKISERLKFVP